MDIIASHSSMLPLMNTNTISTNLTPQDYQRLLPNFSNGPLAEQQHPSQYATTQEAPWYREVIQQNSFISLRDYSAILSGPGAQQNATGIEYGGQSRSGRYPDPLRGGVAQPHRKQNETHTKDTAFFCLAQALKIHSTKSTGQERPAQSLAPASCRTEFNHTKV